MITSDSSSVVCDRGMSTISDAHRDPLLMNGLHDFVHFVYHLCNRDVEDFFHDKLLDSFLRHQLDRLHGSLHDFGTETFTICSAMRSETCLRTITLTTSSTCSCGHTHHLFDSAKLNALLLDRFHNFGNFVRNLRDERIDDLLHILSEIRFQICSGRAGPHTERRINETRCPGEWDDESRPSLSRRTSWVRQTPRGRPQRPCSWDCRW